MKPAFRDQLARKLKGARAAALTGVIAAAVAGFVATGIAGHGGGEVRVHNSDVALDTTSSTDNTTTSSEPSTTTTTTAPTTTSTRAPVTTTTATTEPRPTTTTTVSVPSSTTTTSTVPPIVCASSPAGGVANLRVSRISQESADIVWDCFPGVDPAHYYYDGAYVSEEKGGQYGTDWGPALKVYSGTKIMPVNLQPGTDYWFRIAPLQNGQPGVWEEIAVHTPTY